MFCQPRREGICRRISKRSKPRRLEERYGRKHVDDFLRHEADQYLHGRSEADEPEPPLSRTKPDAGYLYYRKGSVAMYRLADAVGAGRVDAALRAMLRQYGGQGPPYPVPDDLIRAFREAIPEADHELVDDLFDRVITFDLEAKRASARKTSDSESALPAHSAHQVEFDFEATKFRFDEDGTQHSAPFHGADKADIIAYAEDGDEIYRRKHQLDGAQQTITFPTDERPMRVEIGPAYLFFDRNSSDNAVSVDIEGVD